MAPSRRAARFWLKNSGSLLLGGPGAPGGPKDPPVPPPSPWGALSCLAMPCHARHRADIRYAAASCMQRMAVHIWAIERGHLQPQAQDDDHGVHTDVLRVVLPCCGPLRHNEASSVLRSSSSYGAFFYVANLGVAMAFLHVAMLFALGGFGWVQKRKDSSF